MHLDRHKLDHRTHIDDGKWMAYLVAFIADDIVDQKSGKVLPVYNINHLSNQNEILFLMLF